ncbi:UDP-galactopyranose mutase [Dulcicalothrix desertica PCC 7102]|uniref:UDP-galactopyranose mutase n=1 Tax=Dulcicalothrix desertica PCC 7102 TaxID=232991 RepID=A0A3S1AMQ3_9CYAN|nr:UDP-galactopyranose mutase [Dulcicalothrix desertica]RUT04799.1 UDP-galactopyranose mutase [Dulcicalothrix desertica PCC 7102]TWH42810.1 UDP-galactopyranose mutase [Dulcicalothrix desertica PCC 7102]
MKVDWLIVGAGFSGCVLAERIASQLGQRVLLMDKRDHIGGNAYDYYNEHGILVHKYGPHIFHTKSKKVWDYLSQFTEWRPYFHHVLGVVEGKKVPIPFNLNSLYALFPPKYAEKLEEKLLDNFGFGVKVPILKLRESANGELEFLANYIYDNVFVRYTAKQWELKPEELDKAVTGRVPVYISRDDRYFQDPYQAMPKYGYTEMFRKMLAHPNIKVLLNADYREVINDIKFNRMVYTGPVDTFFDYMYGELPYRSLRFSFETLDQEHYQEVGTVNYPNEYDITRITEQKYLSGQTSPKTTLVKEYPQAYVPGLNDPYYPVPREENRARYELYLKEANKLNGSVIFAGRLAEYKYYDMDQAALRALGLFEKEVQEKTPDTIIGSMPVIIA